MSKRLSKIAKDLGVRIPTIVEFLNTNGIECEEDPSVKLSEDVVIFLKNNLSSYLSENEEAGEKVKEQVKAAPQLSEKATPLELQIIEKASQYTKLIERIIGYTHYKWQYSVVKFHGTCSQPVKFTVFDEVICGLLLKRSMSLTEIGRILGLDIEKDPAERNILLSAIKDLKKDQMVEGDDSIYWLTDVGTEYARNGVKFSTFERDFELYIDETANVRNEAKKVFSNLVSEKIPILSNRKVLENIDEVRELAEIQAPEIHYPANSFMLQACKTLGEELFVAKVWVVLLENFRDKTNRVLVYDEKSGKIIEPLSDALSQDDVQKKMILDKLLAESNDAEFKVRITDEQKNTEQTQQEQDLIQIQDKIEDAIDKQDIETVVEIKKEVSSIKRHFNSLEFEVELKRLFDETKGDLWIISPWIKKRATFQRIPFFQQYMNKGGRIFVAYSQPEDGVQEMADQEPLDALMKMEQQFQNFYIYQLPPFHYKRVLLLNNGVGELYYTGSYNILSFFVQQGYQNIRQEEMTKLEWDSENDVLLNEILEQFGNKYIELETKKFQKLCDEAPNKIDKAFVQKFKALTFNKLKPFIDKGFEEFDSKYESLLEERDNMAKVFREKYLAQELERMKKDIGRTTQIVSIEKKRSYQNALNTLINEFPEVETYPEKDEVLIMIDRLQTPKFGKISKGKKRR